MIRSLRLALLAGAAIALNAPPAGAHITRIVIDPALSQSPAFEGRLFGEAGTVGPYEKLRGKAYGEVDPNDPRNAVITDIALAPRNARGRVEYSMDIFILKPVDLRRGSHKLLLDVNNRGEMRVAALNDAPGTNNPTTAAHAGTGFIMNLGYAIVGNGWDVGTADGLTISVPVAKNPDGTSITGPSYEYINFDEPGRTRYALTYPAATLDKSRAVLTVRASLDEQPAIVPADGWEYVDAKTIRLLPADTPFTQSHVYEFRYTARDPVVAALGLAATRDFVSFLRHATKDEAGNPNPLAGDVRHTYSFSISQPSRTLNDFQAFGFNEDEQGARVIDGMLKWTGGGSGDQINYRFAQTGRTERNRQDHLYPEGIFPFAYPVLTDHVSGRTGGRNTRCTASNTCPKVFDANSSNEYWVKAGSLLHTDTQGRDLPDPANVRFYLISGLSHGVGNAANKGVCQQFLNPNSPFPVLRALLTALDQWVTHGTEPPPSRVPRLADRTAVMAVPRPGHQTGVVPQDALGWPAIHGVTYTGLVTTRYHLDFGSGLDKGIIANYPPSTAGRPAYPSFVSKVDADGNEVAGIRVPPVEAPIATTTGWALRRTGFGENSGCEGSGQFIPFAATRADRAASGDPRLSLEERYRTHEGYVAAVTRAAEQLHRQRLLLPADVRRYTEQAQASDVLRNAVSSAQRRTRTTLDIYVVDVEGGNATLFVAPSGESVLIDSGNGGAAAARDAGRIADAARDAGITQIDHHITTHWHGDHFGGMAALAALMPIRAYYDHGPTVEPQPASTEFLANVYPALTAGGKRHIVRPGERIPIKGLDWRIVAAGGRVLDSPLAGAGERNPHCAAYTPRDPDPTENAQSVSSHITFGRFRVVHPGDLTWNKEGDLMCPVNRLGAADLLIVGHHGQPVSNSPPIVHGLRPRVSIINNGTRKGGQPDAMKIILNSPGLEDVWQSHFSLLSGQEYTVPGIFIANMLDEQPATMPIAAIEPPPLGPQTPPPPQHNGKAFWFKVVAQEDGTFTVTNTRNNFTKTYRAGGRQP